MHHIREFSRRANTYNDHMPIQQSVAKHLISGLQNRPKRILDLGCGSGEIYRSIDWDIEHFVGVDSSKEMSQNHPISANVEIINEDFESPILMNSLNFPYDLIISSSALQWSKSIETMIGWISSRCHEGAFAIFTDKTFEKVYQLSGLEQFLPNASELIRLFEKHFICRSEVKTFKLFFEDNQSAFRYIKCSGVSGGKRRLSVAQTKALIQNYPLSYLEFEVLFVWGFPKAIDPL